MTSCAGRHNPRGTQFSTRTPRILVTLHQSKSVEGAAGEAHIFLQPRVSGLCLVLLLDILRLLGCSSEKGMLSRLH